MKQIIVVALGLILSNNLFAQDPVIMQVDDDKVTKSEFLQIYLKNNNNPKYDQASLDEYMDLFKKFKLKVAEAEDLGYDTIPKLKRELEGYQKQLALPYLIDSATTKSLIDEAYEHMKQEVRASHILIKVEPNAIPADTLAAYNKILALKARLEKGEDFAYVAKGKNGSEDPSARDNGGDLGYFTAFQMVYPFEKMAYETKVGEISNPFRTRFGYHILKVQDKRPARGTIKVAHLMIAANKGISDSEIEKAEKKANEIYEKLKQGADFNEMVKQFSDDPSSSSNGGVLPEFGTGATTRMVSEFEDAAFALKNNGDFSAPVRTDYGFHIIKRLEWNGVPEKSEMKKELENRVNRDERSKITQDSFVIKLKKEYGYKSKSKKGLKWFYQNVDSSFLVGKWKADDLKSNKLLFKIDNKKYGQQAFADYLEKNYRGLKNSDLKTLIDEKYAAYEKEAILELEKEKLPIKYPEYKALMKEYHDGILLYEVMSDKVWNKAMTDTSGLKKFFEENKSNYMWGKRIDGIIYECQSAEIGDAVYGYIQKGLSSDSIRKIVNKDTELNLRIKEGKYEIEKVPYLKAMDELNPKVQISNGLNKPFMYEDKYHIVFVNNILYSSQKELSDAKGLITSDYQNHLEQLWLDELNAKHKVIINKDVLYSLGQ